MSDHAALRYLERVYGVDVSALKRRIADQTEEARSAGACSVQVSGVRYYLSAQGVVTTVAGISREMTKRGKRWRRRHK